MSALATNKSNTENTVGIMSINDVNADFEAGKLLFQEKYDELFTEKNLKNNFSEITGYSQAGLTFWKEYLEFRIFHQRNQLKKLRTPQEAIPIADKTDLSKIQSENDQKNWEIGRATEFLEKLEAAYLRITVHKTYAGHETMVGYRYIDPARLFSVPHATQSIQAKNANLNTRYANA